MLDYEIAYYKVEYREIGSVNNLIYLSETEERAIAFIKDRRFEWEFYRLLKVQRANIFLRSLLWDR